MSFYNLLCGGKKKVSFQHQCSNWVKIPAVHSSTIDWGNETHREARCFILISLVNKKNLKYMMRRGGSFSVAGVYFKVATGSCSLVEAMRHFIHLCGNSVCVLRLQETAGNDGIEISPPSLTGSFSRRLSFTFTWWQVKCGCVLVQINTDWMIVIDLKRCFDCIYNKLDDKSFSD